MTRVGYLLKKFPRLSETFVLGEILAQEDAGTWVHVFSRKAPDDEPRHPELARLAAEVEVLPGKSTLDPWTELFGGDAAGADEAHDWERLGAAVRALAPFQLQRLPRLVAEALYVRRRARELRLDHLHAHFATDSSIVAMLVHELGGPPYSVTAHAKDIYRSTVDPRLLGRIVSSSAFTVTVCDANVAFLRERLSDDARRVRRLYNGLHLPSFEYAESGRADDHLLAVGRLVPKKGFDVFLQALAALRDRGRSFRATIIGDGEDRAALEALSRGLALDGLVEFRGARAQDEVREALAEATVFCLPCLVGDDGNRDALPTVLLEALAVGLPCVSTPVTGIPEILDRGAAGMLVPERDVVATADALEALLGDRMRRLEFARAGRARAERLFDAVRSARTLAGWFAESTGECVAAHTEPRSAAR